MTGCDNRETTPETTTAVAGEAQCKLDIGQAALIVVSDMPEDSIVPDRYSAMLAYFDEVGSFPESCNDYSLQQMRPWMEYAGTLIWYCTSIDPQTRVDTSELFFDRPLGEWLIEYGVPSCPLIN